MLIEKELKMRITTKITLITAIFLVIIVVVQAISAVIGTNNIIEVLDDSEHQNQQTGLYNEIEANFDMLKTSQIPIVNNVEILTAFANRDREALAKLTLPMMQDFEELGIQQFHFHLPDATSFLRVQKPEEFGDDLSSFRQTVVQANDQQQTVAGLEGGVSGIGYRYVVPLSLNNEHLGTVELGLSLEEGFLQSLKDNFNSEWTLYGFENDTFTFMSGTTEESDITFSDEQIQRVRNGEAIHYLAGNNKISAFPLEDFSGNVHWFLVSAKDYTEILAKEKSVLVNVLIASVFLSIIGLALIILMMRKMLKPITVLSTHAEQIAQGDLTVEQPIFNSKDEIGKLADSFNKMSTNLKSLIRNIQAKSDEITSNAAIINERVTTAKTGIEQIVYASEQVDENSRQSMQSSDDTAQAMNEMTEGIVRMADNTAIIASSTSSVNDVAIEGHHAVQSAVNQMHIIEEHITQFGTVIQELDTDSHEISTIMQLITGISEQTNLLALNAAIEAARAGEAGKGFAVVADEIRKLADQTSQSASKVYTLIAKIQNNTSNAVTSMASNQKEVHQGIVIIEEVGTNFNQIAKAIGGLSVEIDELSASSEQMSASAEEVTAAVHEIAQSSVNSAQSANTVVNTSKEQLEGMEEISEATNSLTAMSQQLQKSIQTFKV